MDLSHIIQIVSTVAMTLGIVFGILNLRNFQAMRKREAAILRHEIAIDLVDDAFSGPIIQSWGKLGKYVEAFRARVHRETGFEWFQWLAERMVEREQHGSAIPAYIAHRN